MFIKLHPTRYEGLYFTRQDVGLWRIVDCHDNTPKKLSDCRFVGHQYKSKAELLQDLEPYAKTWGY